ncbi:MAG TPA: hypothetical protein PLF40_14220 [Kofleriaceae bacterium]|nr:hypothetical protein [Kofleriaceae bacterium]
MQAKLLFVVTPAMALLAACGSSKKATPDAKIVLPVDAAPVTIDAPPACEISSPDFGDKGAVTMGGSVYNPGMPANGLPAAPYVGMFAPLTATATPDAIFVDFYSGYAPFGTETAPTPLVTGTYQISGDQLNFATCGVCVTAAAKLTQNSNAGDFMATGGTVDVTMAGNAVGGTLTLKLTNVTFEQVTIDEATLESTPVGNNCKTKVGNMTYTGVMEAPAAKPSAPNQRVRVRLTKNRY